MVTALDDDVGDIDRHAAGERQRERLGGEGPAAPSLSRMISVRRGGVKTQVALPRQRGNESAAWSPPQT